MRRDSSRDHGVSSGHLPLQVLERAWSRYEARAKGILEAGLADETKEKVLSTVRKHAAALVGLQGQVA